MGAITQDQINQATNQIFLMEKILHESNAETLGAHEFTSENEKANKGNEA